MICLLQTFLNNTFVIQRAATFELAHFLLPIHLLLAALLFPTMQWLIRLISLAVV